MKKLVLLSAIIAAVGSANAQLALQNFNATGIPAGWTMINDGKTISSALNPVIVTKLGANAWMKWPSATAGDSLMITTSLFSPAGTADRWLISPAFLVNDVNTMLMWKDAQMFTLAGDIDVLEVLMGASTATVASDFTTSLWSGNPSISGSMDEKGLSLSAYNGSTIRIAFRAKGTNAGVLGLDDVQTKIMPVSNDASADALDVENIVLGSSSTPVKVTISNKGTTKITSVKASYKVDGGAAVSQTFSGLSLIYGTSATLTFSTPITGTSVAAHALEVNIEEVNATADDKPSNNKITKNFSTASKSVDRSGLMEEFTSSTCVPCASFNSSFDPLIVSIKANDPATRFNIVKYQMNWPNPGNDVCYNGDGLARRTYYMVTGIPDHYTNGQRGANGDMTEINNSKVALSFMDISGTYVVKGDSLIADVTVTPHFTGTGNYKLHMAATEYHYTNPGATTTQKEYYHVMRQMLNAGAGVTISSFTNGVPQTFHWGTKFTTGTPVQLSNTFWGSPFSGNLVTFVQNESDKSVLQSQSVPATWPVSVPSLNAVISQTSVYPNPAVDHVSVAFKLESASKVGITISDAMGRTVYTVAEQQLTAGTQVVNVPTAAFASGVYIVNLNANGASVTERFSVVK